MWLPRLLWRHRTGSPGAVFAGDGDGGVVTTCTGTFQVPGGSGTQRPPPRRPTARGGGDGLWPTPPPWPFGGGERRKSRSARNMSS